MSTGTREPPGAGPALPGAGPPGGGPPARDVPSTDGVTRVTVLAPGTRVDVALPDDVALAELVPVLRDMAGQDPGSGPAWTLAVLGDAPADPERTLAGLGVLDGDHLVLRRTADAAPAPLYDDVVDAVAQASPPAYRAWGPDSARRASTVALAAAAGVALVALAEVGRGPGTAGGALTAAVAGALAVVGIALAVAAARLFAQEAVAGVLAVAGVAAAGLAGVAAVPAGDGGGGVGSGLSTAAGPPHLLLGSALVLVAALVALAAAGTAGRWVLAVLVALGALGALGTVVGVVAVAAGALAPPGGGPDPSAVAAGLGAAATVGLAALPRAAIAVARLPLPSVPGSSRELADDDAADGAVSHRDIERRADRAHAAMTGLVLAAALAVAGACAVLAGNPAPGLRGVLGGVLAVLLAVLLALRSRTYANAVQASALLLGAVLAAAAVLLGALRQLPPGAGGLVVVGSALVGGAGCLLAAAGPRRSPSVRRAVGVVEAVVVAAVLPLALGVMDLYTVVRML